MSEPTHYKQKQEKSGDTIAENKHRKEEKQKTIFSFPQKFSRSEKKKDGVGLPLASPDMLYKERTPKTNLRGSQSGGYLFVLISQSSNDYFYARAKPSDWGVFGRFARSAIRGTPSPAQRGSTHRYPRYARSCGEVQTF